MKHELLQKDPEDLNEGSVVTVLVAEKLVYLRDLVALTSYILFVRAINVHGAGPYSTEVVATTLEKLTSKSELGNDNVTLKAVPAAPPLNLLAVAMVPGIALTWDELSVDQWNGVLMVYEVLYETQVGENATATWNLVNATVPVASITNMEGDVTCKISVRARNENGPGPYSEVVIATTLKDDTSAGPVNTTSSTPPGAPRNVEVCSVTLTTLVLKWDRVNVTGQNDEDFVSYAVHYQALVEGSTEEIVNTTELGVVLLGLIELTPYAFSVRAFVMAGPSPFSEVGFVKTVERSRL